MHWATYTPEETGVVIAYASVYGNTENAAEHPGHASLARTRRAELSMYDVSVTPASDIVAAALPVQPPGVRLHHL